MAILLGAHGWAHGVEMTGSLAGFGAGFLASSVPLMLAACRWANRSRKSPRPAGRTGCRRSPWPDAAGGLNDEPRIMSNSAFFRLQQPISPSLPIGAFTYSQGMEWAVECGWIKDADDVYVWLDALESSVGALESVLARLYHASQQQDLSAFSHWADTLLAWRETSELRAEECQRGQALTMVLDKLPDAAGWPELQETNGAMPWPRPNWPASPWPARAGTWIWNRHSTVTCGVGWKTWSSWR